LERQRRREEAESHPVDETDNGTENHDDDEHTNTSGGGTSSTSEPDDVATKTYVESQVSLGLINLYQNGMTRVDRRDEGYVNGVWRVVLDAYSPGSVQTYIYLGYSPVQVLPPVSRQRR